MRSGSLVVFEIGTQNTAQPRLIQNDHMVSALATDRSNESFHVSILPGRLGSGQDLLDAQASSGFVELLSVDSIPIPQQKARGFIPRKSFYQLVRCPFRGGIFRDREMNKPTPVVRENHEDEEDAEEDGGNHEEIRRDKLLCVVFEECAPRLRRRFPTTRHIFSDCRLRQVEAQLQEFSMDLRSTPTGIG